VVRWEEVKLATPLMALELSHMAPGSSIHVLLYTKVKAAPSPVEALEE